MKTIKRLYKKSNYTIRKTITIDDRLYNKIKELSDKEYDTTISELINVCIEEMIDRKDVWYTPKPKGEIAIYRRIMVRKENIDALNKINRETGISLTRLINISMKEFIGQMDSYE